MISPNIFSTLISLFICYLMSTMPSESSIVLQDHRNTEGTSGLLELIKIEFEKQNHRIELLEHQNRNQDEDIGQLKLDTLNIHDQIDLIKDGEQSNEDEPASNLNYDNDGDVPLKKQYQKRAFRLIPPTLLL